MNTSAVKRFFKAIVAAVIVLTTAACAEDRSKILKVYNWGDYIDEDLIPEFEKWYFEQTGEEVHIIYQTFDINETMLSKIEKGHEDYDVVCPSDYIIERMLRKGLLLPIGRDFGDTPNHIDSNIAPFIREMISEMESDGKDVNDYAVPYMWGTTGILYNTKHVDEEDTHTWDILRNDKYSNKIFVKDAANDVFGPILMYLKRDLIRTGEITFKDVASDFSDESLAAVEEYMNEVRKHIAGWEADFGKEQMTQERGYVNFTWSGDAVWAIEEAKEVGVSLEFTVPDEGSCVWFDGWVIPKFAGNPKAARYFIDFLCIPENAIRNMDVIGYVSAIATPDILEEMEDEEEYEETVDVSYFFGKDAHAEHLNPTQYPDKSVIERCSVMYDWGDRMPELVAMWARVKGNRLNWWTIFVISVTILGITAGRVAKHIKKKSRRTHTHLPVHF